MAHKVMMDLYRKKLVGKKGGGGTLILYFTRLSCGSSGDRLTVHWKKKLVGGPDYHLSLLNLYLAYKTIIWI